MTDGDGDGDDAGTGGRRTPEQERRAAERARRIRERRSAERSGRSGRSGSRETDPAADRDGGPDGEEIGPSVGERDGTPRPGRRSAAAVRERTAARSADRGRTRDPRHRRRRTVALVATVVVALLGVSAAAWWGLAQYGPGVASVEVTGARQIPARDVVDAAAVDIGTPLAAVDTAAVASRVSAIPGVATVDVDRSWPDTLTVAVTERTPVALADTPDGRMLVDVAGFAYRPAPPDVRLPVLQLSSVAPDDPATLAAVAVLRALPQPVRDQVETLSAGAAGSTFELGLTEGRRVLWGPWADGAATERRAAVLGPLLGREGTVYDVSSPALVTVRDD
ncbi:MULTISPECIES: cell division protein FtsQ/DivIB [unclassified Pseudonocardia]|uniref:cell division protein FtsQ/DivIB n=1 Tax=unclassified Pseudonocardia TaxID=2619320 RepID=UPI0007615237|nr:MULTISPECIES: FtsQ-type POTRA domain-containing protein [unclassified Pseudonocardia]